MPTIEPRKLQGEDVWFADIAWPDGRCDQVGAFQSRSDVEHWIAGHSNDWLADYERRWASEATLSATPRRVKHRI